MNGMLLEFFNHRSSDNLGRLMKDCIGESDHLDYKREWPVNQKVARHILGFANSGGGVMIIGVEQCEDGSMAPVGLTHFRDTTMIHDGIRKFLPEDLEFDVDVIDVPDANDAEHDEIRGKKFQIVRVLNRPEHLPFVAAADGDGLHSGDVYVRNGASTRRATHMQLQEIVNRRIATGYSTGRELTLKEHLEELKVLYAEVRPVPMVTIYAKAFTIGGQEEDYQAFVRRVITSKKAIVEEFLQGQ